MTYSLAEFMNWRKALGINQEQAALMLGVSKQSVACYETGRRKWGPKPKAKFKAAYSTPKKAEKPGPKPQAAVLSDPDSSSSTWDCIPISRPLS